jgi:hypothetical protein
MRDDDDVGAGARDAGASGRANGAAAAAAGADGTAKLMPGGAVRGGASSGGGGGDRGGGGGGDQNGGQFARPLADALVTDEEAGAEEYEGERYTLDDALDCCGRAGYFQICMLLFTGMSWCVFRFGFGFACRALLQLARGKRRRPDALTQLAPRKKNPNPKPKPKTKHHKTTTGWSTPWRSWS